MKKNEQKSKFLTWLDERFPASKLWESNMTGYYAPKNFNFWYFFGVFSLLVLVNQIVTGIWIVMHYTPTAEGAFQSIEDMMRHVEYGWLLRYMHSTGASAFFVVIYLHMYRCLMYGSYKKPRELLWLFGMTIYLLLLLEAFTGYVLPWGQMSYWGAQVITALFEAIPFVGSALTEWVRGDYTISQITLQRFFSLHVIAIPLLIVGVVVFHIVALRTVGSNNPDGIEIKKNIGADGKPVDGIPFHPYFTIKDLFGIGIFLFVFATVIFFFPEGGGFVLEHDNFTPSNHLATPEHIVPAWYMTPFYAILRAVPDKLFGVITMGAAIAVLFILPWLDRSPVKSIRYKGTLSKIALTLFTISFVSLGYLGLVPPTPLYTLLAQIFTVIYFLFFLLMPFYTSREQTKPEPKRVTTS